MTSGGRPPFESEGERRHRHGVLPALLSGCIGAVLLITVCAVTLCQAGENSADADKQFAYAESCLTQGHYGRAADEFARFLYYYPEDPRHQKAQFQMGTALFRNGDIRAAVRIFQPITAGSDKSEMTDEAYFMLSRCYLALDQAGAAITTLHNLMIETRLDSSRARAHYDLGWIALSRTWIDDTDLESHAPQDAARSFEKAGQLAPEQFEVQGLLDELKERESIPWKKPWLAGTLSVIPGGGQLYCGRYQDAVTAFLLNGILIFAACESFDKELYALGGLITMVELGFYGGNIYGAISSAHKYNRARKRHFVEDLGARFGSSDDSGTSAVGVSVSIPF